MFDWNGDDGLRASGVSPCDIFLAKTGFKLLDLTDFIKLADGIYRSKYVGKEMEETSIVTRTKKMPKLQQKHVTDTLWARFEEREDPVVPFPKSCEDDTFIIGDYWNKQCYEKKNTCVKPTEQNASDSKNEVPGSDVDPGSHAHTEEELSSSRYNLDSWSNFSSVDNSHNTISKEGSKQHGHGSISSAVISNFSDALNSDQARDTEFYESGDILYSNNTSSYKETCGLPFADKMEIDSKRSVFSSGHGHQEVDSFLDCDWGSITDFDDLDGIFRNSGSIFGHEMARDVDELLSPTDSSNTVKPSLPFDAISVCMDVSTENGSSSFQETEKSQGKRKISKNDKVPGQMVFGKQTECPSRFNCEERQTNAQQSNMEGHKTLSKFQKKMDEKKTIKSQKMLKEPSYNEHRVQQFKKYASFPAAPHSFRPSVFPHPGQVEGPDYVGYFPSTYHAFTGYGYPAFPFPFPQHVNATSKPAHFPPACNGHLQHETGNLNSIQNPDAKTRMPKMTPQEKIEKLRRRQQMQALLAIKQQGKHFGRHVGNPDDPPLQEMLQMNQYHCPILSPTSKTEEQMKIALPLELNPPNERDDSFAISVASDDHTLQETVFHDFQEAVVKLDDSLKLRFKESLYRLARNAMERRNVNDGSSANVNSANEGGDVKNEVTYFHDRSTAAMYVETDTNHIDRIVAHLLFPFPPTSSAMIGKEKMPVSPVPRIPDPNHCSTSSECISEDKAECQIDERLLNVVE